MAGLSVGSRLEKLKERIANAEKKSGRASGSVKLLAVSKLQDVEKIRAAFACGQLDFAENYAQEAMVKAAELADLPLRWHFIGRIQSNKIKSLAKGFAIIHSLERAEHAEALNRQVESVQDVFLQFNVADEASKGGLAESELEHLLTAVEKCANLRMLGLMVMPPLLANPEDVRPYFARARKVLQKLKAHTKHPMNELSMGTSSDFTVAIEEGATWVRIGTEAFGPREEE